MADRRPPLRPAAGPLPQRAELERFLVAGGLPACRIWLPRVEALTRRHTQPGHGRGPARAWPGRRAAVRGVRKRSPGRAADIDAVADPAAHAPRAPRGRRIDRTCRTALRTRARARSVRWRRRLRRRRGWSPVRPLAARRARTSRRTRPDRSEALSPSTAGRGPVRPPSSAASGRCELRPLPGMRATVSPHWSRWPHSCSPPPTAAGCWRTRCGHGACAGWPTSRRLARAGDANSGLDDARRDLMRLLLDDGLPTGCTVRDGRARARRSGRRLRTGSESSRRSKSGDPRVECRGDRAAGADRSAAGARRHALPRSRGASWSQVRSAHLRWRMAAAGAADCSRPRRLGQVDAARQGAARPRGAGSARAPSPFAYVDFDKRPPRPARPGRADRADRPPAAAPVRHAPRRRPIRRAREPRRRHRRRAGRRHAAGRCRQRRRCDRRRAGPPAPPIDALAGRRRSGPPLVLVLDTFEEVQLQGPGAVQRRLDLVDRLRAALPGQRAGRSAAASVPAHRRDRHRCCGSATSTRRGRRGARGARRRRSRGPRADHRALRRQPAHAAARRRGAAPARHRRAGVRRRARPQADVVAEVGARAGPGDALRPHPRAHRRPGDRADRAPRAGRAPGRPWT